eukprot:gene32121-28779_t
MASGGIYEGLDEIGRLVASLDAQMNLHNTSPVFGVGSAPDLGFEGSVLHAKGAACAGVVLAEGGAPTKMSAIEVDGAIYCAIKATERIEKNGELGVLTRDMAAAIYLYTMDCNFYKQLNKLLREED